MALNLQLYDYQKEAMLSPANEILVGGSAGPGKSYFLRALATILAIEVPGISIFLFRRLYKELIPNHMYGAGKFMEMYKEMMDAGDVDLNKSEGIFTFWNQSRIYLCHAQYEDDVQIYLGAEINVLLVDEAVQFTETMIRFLRSRVRLGSLDVPEKWRGLLPKAIYATNPRGIGARYLKQGFVDHGPMKIHRAEPEDGGMLRQYIPALYTANKVMMKNDPSYADRLRGLGDPKLVEAYLKGSWDESIDGIFAGVWDPTVHIIDYVHIPAGWRIDRGYDYGSSAPAGALYFAESNGESIEVDGQEWYLPARSLIVIGEIYFANEKFEGLNLTPEQMAEVMLRYEFRTKLRARCKPGPADKSIYDAAPGYESVATKMRRCGVTFVKSDKSTGSRKRGVAFTKQMLLAARTKSKEHPHLYVVRTCKHLIRTLPNLPRSEDEPDDVDTHAEDHLFDVVRYRVLRAKSTVGRAEVQGA